MRRASSLLLLASLLVFSGSVYADAQSLFTNANERVERFTAHYRRTFDQQSLAGELGQAATELTEAARLAQNENDMALMAKSMAKLGDVYRYQGNHDLAIRAYEQAAQVAMQVGNAEAEVRALLGHSRSLLYGKKAPGPARPLIEKANRQIQQVTDPELQFDVLDVLAQLQLEEGNIAGAADSINRAFRVKGVTEDKELLFYGYFDRALVYQKLAEQGTSDGGDESHLHAAELARRDFQSALETANQLNWPALAQQMQGFLNRLKLTEQMIERQKDFRNLLAETQIFSPRKPEDVLISESFTPEASPEIALLFQTIEQMGGLPLPDDSRGAYLRGWLDDIAGKRDDALKWYLRATDLLETDRRKLYDESGRGEFLEDKVTFYYTAITHLLDRKHYDQAFELMERARGRVMADLIATKQISLPSDRERKLYSDLLSLDSELALYQNHLFNSQIPDEATPEAADQPVPADIEELRAQIAGLQKKRDELRQLMAKQASGLANLVSAQPVSLDQLQRVLKEDGSELLTYLCLDSQLIAWHITPDKVDVKPIFIPLSELAAKVEKLRKTLVSPQVPFDTQTANELYLYLVSPFADQLRSNRLVIVPHEDLFYLPFQALSVDGDGRFLADDYRISYAPSATVLTSLKAPKPLKPKLKSLGLADPQLQNAPREIQAIANLHKGRFETDQLPTEAEVKSWVPKAELIHFAVHGSFLAEEPLLSCLHLRKADGDDGRLTAAEMYGLPLDDARLVVLSACETGIVRATHASEVLGITRGLLFAGAESLILSAWAIDDEGTANWMAAFYESARTNRPSDAAHLAIQSLRSDARYVHPFYWSPFLVIGR